MSCSIFFEFVVFWFLEDSFHCFLRSLCCQHWSPRPPINTARHGACAAAFAGYLYVSGSSRFPVEPYGMTRSERTGFLKSCYSNFEIPRTQLLHQNRINCVVLVFRWCCRIFLSQVHFQQKEVKFIICKDWWWSLWCGSARCSTFLSSWLTILGLTWEGCGIGWCGRLCTWHLDVSNHGMCFSSAWLELMNGEEWGGNKCIVCEIWWGVARH